MEQGVALGCGRGRAWVERVWSKGGATVEHKRRTSMEQEKCSGESICLPEHNK